MDRFGGRGGGGGQLNNWPIPPKSPVEALYNPRGEPLFVLAGELVACACCKILCVHLVCPAVVRTAVVSSWAVDILPVEAALQYT